MSADSCASTIKNEVNLQSLPTLETTSSARKTSNFQQPSNNKKFMFTKHKSLSIANLANSKNKKQLDSNNNSIEYEDDDDDDDEDYEFEANYNENSNSINLLDDVLQGFNLSSEDNDDIYQLASNNIDPISTTTTSNANTNTLTISTNANANNKASNQNTNNKVIKSFLKLIRPSLHRRRKNRHMNASSTLNLRESFELSTLKVAKSSKKKASKKKLRSSRSIGVLNDAKNDCNDFERNNDIDIEIIDIRRKNKNLCRINSTVETNNLGSSRSSSKNNKASRTFSMINKSSMFSSSVSSYNSVSITSNNNSGSLATTPNGAPILSKELTWYKLQELDGYYKILGKFKKDLMSKEDGLFLKKNNNLTRE